MRTLALAFFSLLAAPLTAQVTDSTRRDSVRETHRLSAEAATDIAALYNQPAAMRVSGRLEIAADQTVNGNVAVLDGPVLIAGHVTGSLILVNGDITLAPTARIDGDLIVAGGSIAGRERASIGGEVQWYRQALRYRQVDDRIIAERDRRAVSDEEGWMGRWRRRQRSSTSKLSLVTGGTYNRVEGLAVHFGPTIRQNTRWGHARLEALGIIRSADHFEWDSHNLGHELRAELRAGGTRGVAIGAKHFDVVDAVELWQLRDTEVGLASFFLHRDFRDYFDRHGAVGYVSLLASDEVGVTFAYSDQKWGSRDQRDPFSLFRGSDPWRPNPRMDDGRFRLGTVSMAFDTRSDQDDPWSGWYVVADFERGSGKEVRLGPTSPLARASSATPVAVRYTRGFMDLRRYNRLSPDAQLNLRLVVGGWVGGDELPLQRRLSVGGPGSLPGFDFRRLAGSADAGQCSGGEQLPGRPAQCERIALAQAEYRGDLHFRFSSGTADEDSEESDLLFTINRRGEWVVFVDAGRGWLVGPNTDDLRYRAGKLPPLDTFRTDVGVGVDFDILGFYVAKSVSHTRVPANFFVRLRHRF